MLPISLHSKRTTLALRFFTYGVMTLATVVLTTLAIFYAMGYRFNQATLTFEQGGLVQFRSTPEGATVVIDGKVQNFRTPGRANLPAGVHTIVMQNNGYRDWQRTVSVAPGQLLWLNYTRLIPNSITTVPLKTFPSLAAVLPSPDHRWMVIQEKPDASNFTLADFNNEKTPVYTTFTLPEAKLTKVNGAYGQITLAEWDLSSRYYLVHHQNGTVNEWLRVDRAKPEEAVNLSQVFRLSINDAHFAGNNPNLVYVKTDDVVRRLDIGSSNASAALVTGVKQFAMYSDTVAFTATRQATPGDATTTQEVVGLYKHDKETLAQAYPAGTQLKIAYSEYDNHGYLAIHKGDGAVQVLRDVANGAKDTAQFASFTVGQPASWLMFSNNGRMVVAGAGTTVVTYDLELAKTYSSNLSFLKTATEQPRWLDDYYLWTDAGDRLRIVEFDGQNDREITTVSPGFNVLLSASGKTLFSIGKNNITNTYFLQASQLVTQ